MITWMQKHKKYLVVTIWISTIAFVGAGFVGWGAYDMNSNRATSVAKVGNRNITIKDFQQAYAREFNFYAQTSDGKFTKEQADEMGLDSVVLQNLIRESLFLNYADDLGFVATNDDVIKNILADENFHTDGKFDNAKYQSLLKSSGISAADYEERLVKKSILLSKLANGLELKANTAEVDMVGAAFFMKDRVKIDIVSANTKDLKIDEDELKKYWEANKNAYFTDKIFKIETKFINRQFSTISEEDLMKFYEENRANYRDSEDKILDFNASKILIQADMEFKNTKSQALDEYLKIKKGESNLTDTKEISQNDINFPVDIIKDAKKGDVIKPFEYENGFLIVKIADILEPRVKSYEEAREEVLSNKAQVDFKNLLTNLAKERVENFEGTDIGFISRDFSGKIEGLNQTEALTFVATLFDSVSKKGYVILDDKAVVYEILEQKLLDDKKQKEYNELLTQRANALKNLELNSELLSTLQKRYKVEQYYKR